MSEQWRPADHGSDSGALQKKVARGLTWTLVDTWGAQLLAFAVFTILARLLTPDDFGLVALAAVFVSFAQLLVDQGLGDALIQRPSVTRRQIDTAFWVAVLTGVLLTAAGFLLADPIASLMSKPELAPILQVLSLTFVLAALNSIQIALLRRAMRWRSLALRRLSAVGGGGVVGIVMAFGGYGPWALVGQQVAAAAIAVVTLWGVSPWRPGFHFSRADFRSLFSFGINVVAGDVLNFLSRNFDNLLAGVYLGITQLGFYKVGYQILDTSQMLLINFARKLAFPIFSSLQGDLHRLQRAYRRTSGAMAVVVLPGYIGLALVAQQMIVVVFGPQWAASGPVASVLFLIGPVFTIQMFSGALLNAVGHPEITFRIRLVTTVVNVAGFFIAVLVFQDIVALAAAFVIRGYLLMPLIIWCVSRYAHVSARDQLIKLVSPGLATAVMAVAVLVVKFALLDQVGNLLLLVVQVFVGVATFVAAMWVIDRPLLTDVISIAFQAIPGGRKVARRVGVKLPQGGGRGRGRRGRPADVDVEEAVDVTADAAAAEEVVTSGSSVAADSIPSVGSGTGDDALGDL